MLIAIRTASAALAPFGISTARPPLSVRAPRIQKHVRYDRRADGLGLGIGQIDPAHAQRGPDTEKTGPRKQSAFFDRAEVIHLQLHRADGTGSRRVAMDGYADGDIRQARNAAVQGAVTVQQFLSNLAAQGDAVVMQAADLDSEHAVEWNFSEHAKSPRPVLFLVLHGRLLTPIHRPPSACRNRRRYCHRWRVVRAAAPETINRNRGAPRTPAPGPELSRGPPYRRRTSDRPAMPESHIRSGRRCLYRPRAKQFLHLRAGRPRSRAQTGTGPRFLQLGQRGVQCRPGGRPAQ